MDKVFADELCWGNIDFLKFLYSVCQVFVILSMNYIKNVITHFIYWTFYIPQKWLKLVKKIH